MGATPTIYLFDIDGTLLTAHGAGRRAMEAGFAAVTGSTDALSSLRFAGMTDPSIVRHGLEVTGQPHDDATVQRVIDAYLEHLPKQLAARGPLVFPGVVAVLDELQARPDAAVGLGTGNVEAGARTKLAAVDLSQRFEFGGFGSDHERRDRLLAAGAQRGAARLSRPLADCRVVVIGDTPKDIAAARAIGAPCLAVATSYYDQAALAEHDPSCVVADLSTDAARRWLLDPPPMLGSFK